MVLYSKQVANASVGATAGTFDNVGTITLRTDAKKTLGFWVCAAPTVRTAAIETTGVLKISSSDLGIGAQTFMCPPYDGGAPVTNIGMDACKAEFIPWVVDCKGKEQIVVDYSTNLPSSGVAQSVVVALIYDAGKSSALGSEALKTWPDMAPIAKGATTVSQATITTVAETQIVTTMTVPAWAKEIIGIKCLIIPNLMTAGEERVGFVRFRSTIPDFEPMEIPFRSSILPALGTPVGKGVTVQDATAMGMSIPLTGNTETITAYVVLNVAITTGDGVVCTVYYR